MKKFFAVLLAASVLAAPMAYAKDPQPMKQRVQQTEKHVTVEKRVVVTKKTWKKGRTVSRAERRNIVNARDFGRYRLAAPRRGQQWVRIDNTYLLISAATGVILNVTVAR